MYMYIKKWDDMKRRLGFVTCVVRTNWNGMEWVSTSARVEHYKIVRSVIFFF